MVRTHVVVGPCQGSLFGVVSLFLVEQHFVPLSLPSKAYALSQWALRTCEQGLRGPFTFESYATSVLLQHMHLKQDLHWVRSCEQGISSSGLGMLGKVWSTGALQVVQNVAIIPQSVHPRNKLDSAPSAILCWLIPPFCRCASRPCGRRELACLGSTLRAQAPVAPVYSLQQWQLRGPVTRQSWLCRRSFCLSVRSSETSRAGTLARLVSELIYIPIYDVALPEDGVQAVLELVVSADAEENQIVGNVISYVSNILDELQVCTLWCLRALQPKAVMWWCGHEASSLWLASWKQR